MLILGNKRWTNQPPLGVGINFGHPLAKGLTFYTVFNAGAGVQKTLLPSNLPGTVVTGGTKPGKSWLSLDGSQSQNWDGNWGVWYERGTWVEPNWMSVVCFARKSTSNVTGDASLYRKAYQNAGSAPFVSHGINWNPGGAGQGVVGGYIADQGGTLHSPTFNPGVSLALPHMYGLSVGPSGSDGVIKQYFDGIKKTSTTVTGMTGIKYDTTSTGRLILSGAAATSNTVPIIGWVYSLGIWNRQLTDAEMEWLNMEPYAMLSPRRRINYFTPVITRQYSYWVVLERLS